MRRVVITGAAGLVGSLINARLGDRWRIVATDMRSADSVIPLDVTDQRACGEAFTGVDAVIHLAADPDPDAS